MDLAKIRKKARAKEKVQNSEAKPLAPPFEPETAGADRKAEDVPQEPVVARDAEAPPPAVGSPEVQEEETAAETAEDILELLTFRLSNEEFAFKVSEVEEIVRYQSITRVPSLSDYIIGITSLRGKIIPVVDLKKRLALSAPLDDGAKASPEREEREVAGKKILIIAGPKGLIGATIDKVLGVVRFSRGNLLDPPAHLTEEELKFINGVVILEKRFISVIRAEDALNIEVI
jgi:purine-binding chemotaxis protein CheW